MFADRQVDSTILERARRIVEQRVMISRRKRENKARKRREAMVGRQEAMVGPLVGDDAVYIPASDGAAVSGIQQESREEKASRMRQQQSMLQSARDALRAKCATRTDHLWGGGGGGEVKGSACGKQVVEASVNELCDAIFNLLREVGRIKEEPG